MAKVSPQILAYRQKRSQYAKTQFDAFSQYRRNEFNSLPFFIIRDTTGLGWKGVTSILRPILRYASISCQFD